MLVDVKVPVLAESVAEATLLNWQKHTGDEVKCGDNLIDIETDKVTLEIAASNDGVIAEILKDAGEIVYSDEVIAKIDTAAKADAVKADDPEAIPQQRSLPDMEKKTEELAEANLSKLSPAVRNLLEEHQLDATEISSNAARITKEDVLRYIEGGNSNGNTETPPSPAQAEPNQAQPKSAPSKTQEPNTKPIQEPKQKSGSVPVLRSISGGDRLEEKVPMTRLRKRVADRLLNAQHENAILTTFNEVNMQAVMDIRNKHKDEFEKTHGIKLGFMSFFTRAAIEALKKFPIINASVDDDTIVYHGFFDIGIAVSSPRGLVVPIVRNGDTLSLAEIEIQIRGYGEKAREGKLAIDELTGGTFTITNGGVFGSLLSTPIINPPQSAILGMHAIQQRPIAENGEVTIRPMMYLALSYDHRIIDGREAVQFLVSIKQQLEDPARLILQL